MPGRTQIKSEYMRRGIDSVATEDYWSGTPYGLIEKPDHEGNLTTVVTDKDGKKHALKFMIKNCTETPGTNISRVLLGDKDYLGKDLEARAKKGPICYNFYLQFQKDPNAMPVEDASVVWDETDSKPIKVATLHIDDKEFNSPAQKAYCETLVMSPWHGLDSFLPMGSMNRARKFIYLMSAQKKTHYNIPDEPSGFADFHAFEKAHNFVSEQATKHLGTVQSALRNLWSGATHK